MIVGVKGKLSSDLSYLEIDGVGFGPKFGIEMVDRDLPVLGSSGVTASILPGYSRAVWLTRRCCPQGPYERVRELRPDARIVAKGDGWTLECNGAGEGVLRQRKGEAA